MRFLTYLFCIFLVSCNNNSKEALTNTLKQENMNSTEGKMNLGAFSVSLTVKDLEVSKDFYENLGFVQFAGDKKMNYLIMKNEDKVIGLFQGMFENNILTFNPGWDQSANNVEDFKDIREIQNELIENGITIEPKIDSNSNGPASFMITDPDGNTILFDQHR